MREIKFRLVIVEKHPPHWEEKITFLHFTFEQLLRSSKYWPPHYYEDYDLHGGRFIKARDEYTGLKDKKGNEIYEGDIVEFFGGKHWKVIFDTGEACFAIEGQYNTYNFTPINHLEMEVIGNIYESNPELLKEER